ncbi:twitching motility two-component system response regulator PilH [Krasilnikovia cinnamomea]|uniref:Twitching motility two-component system response regulator PilH n=1 Tax=Krasilnikovia cinnamomea TaxID=349313 RepID=A0A4Q7ZHL1_9ACTN|nr:response regulator [Krasilnikovia cinnamomea]RZU49881.1 twitching motility two-component system response regulator PilH [Krasilnikovia cinnamomea]
MAVVVTAEDDEDIRFVIQRVLRGAGHTVIDTADGVAALAAVREHHPQAVVTDFRMPNMDGQQLCQAIRDDPQLRHIPVVVVSGSIDAYDEHALACFDAVVGKPFLPDALLTEVTDVLTRTAVDP